MGKKRLDWKRRGRTRRRRKRKKRRCRRRMRRKGRKRRRRGRKRRRRKKGLLSSCLVEVPACAGFLYLVTSTAESEDDIPDTIHHTAGHLCRVLELLLG